MPAFDLRGIKVAKYTNTNGVISYSQKTSIGDAMNVDMQLTYAEGRLYAESVLAEYIRLATGGTMSIGEKYIPDAAKKLLFGMREGTRSITVSGSAVTATSIKLGGKDLPNYVGVAFYAPDMVDGVQKYTCVFVTRALFAPPSMTYQTKGDTITFQTPTTTGEFLPDHTANQELVETYVADTEEAAIAWVDAVLT